LPSQSSTREIEATPTLCPVTGLPVHIRPEWSEVPISDGYRLTLSMVGARILLVRPVGYCTEPDIRRSSTFIRQVVEEEVPAGQTYVQIGDYSQLDGVTVEARREYIKGIQTRGRLAGVVFYGASPLMQLVIKLGWRINPLPVETRLAEDYHQAVQLAQQLLSGTASPAAASAPAARGWLRRLRPRRLTKKAGMLRTRVRQDGERLLTWPRLLIALATSDQVTTPPPEAAWPELRPPLDGTHLEPHPELDLDLDGLSVRYGMVGDNVLQAATAGYLEHRHVEPIVQRNHEAAAALVGDRPYYFLIGLTDVTGAQVRARQAYARLMTSFHHQHPFRLLVLYSPNRVMRTLIELARPLVPFRVLVAPNLDGALRLVAEDRAPGRTARRTPLEGGTPQDHLSELLHFLGSIDWDADGLGADVPEVSPWHPLKQIFDAVEVLKMDVDQLLLERREAEQALRKSENLLRTFIDATNEAILTVDDQGRVDLFNATAEALFGQSAEAVLGTPFEELLEPSSREHWRELLQRHLADEGQERGLEELSALRSDGVFPLELSLASAVHDGRRYTIAVGRDLTARQRAAAEREELQQQVALGHRLRALGTLAGGVAHDFNNLLMTIQGSITLLLLDARPGSEAHANLKTIQQQVRSGASLTRQLLAYARKGKYELKPLDLNRVLTSTSETFWRTRKDIHVHRDLQQDLRAIEADRSQMEQVVLNLALNAGDAMPHGGDLYFTTRNLGPGERYGTLRAPGASPQVMLEVRDTGQGMDRDTLDRIFEPFFTTKEMGRGTGLGLASVYGTVQSHGGQIHVTSEVGQGTTFTIFFPASEREVQASRPWTPGPDQVHGRLLLVDDEPLVLRVSERVMSRAGFEVLTAGSGEEAVKVYTEHGHRIDLVVLDLIMPDLSGADTFERLKALDPEVRVLLSSGYSLDGEAQRIMDRGCDGFIQKPFDVEEITALISHILRPQE
jgi:PAS domain S-box-containing protein